MKKRFALITGASGGIGKKIALKLAKENYSLYLHYNHNEEAIQDLMKQLNSFDVELIPIQADLSTKDGYKKLVSDIFALHAIVLNSGNSYYGLISDMDEQVVAEMVQLHVTSPFQITKELLPKLMYQEDVYPRLVGDESVRSAGIEPSEDLSVETVADGSPAQLAGVRSGDRIEAVDGTPVFQRLAVSEYLAKNPTRSVEFRLRRGDGEVRLAIQPRMEFDERLGKPVARVGIRYRDSIIIVHPSPFAQIADNVSGTFRTLGALLSPHSDIGPSKLTGPIGIARELHRQAQWDFRRLLWFTILINVNLAIFNLLPIPVLDGGQVVFATLARLRGRALPVNVIIATQSVFMVLLLSMILYVSYFDVARLRRESRPDNAPRATAPAKP